MDETTTTIMAALATLPTPQLSNLTRSIFSETLHRRRRLAAVLSSPTLFSLTLHRLHHLSLHDKTLLIARYLLSSLRHLTLKTTTTTNYNSFLRTRDFDAVLLLLHLCEVRQHSPETLEMSPFNQWRLTLRSLYAETLLSFGSIGIGVHNGSLLVPYIETVARCLRFVVIGSGGDVADAVSAVVALPSVVVGGGGGECVICKEEMREGREVCELPCRHLYHWKCILPWFKKRNTCPYCRFQLPTDDLFGEIQRLWSLLVKMSGTGFKE
ncbi:E3 ubiquitin-protein ligase SGR9, amyloplastic [Humulus lupulus]|uniref:E3 ubiquitin-protein ligase SGR9, amyloplastic n=1 Tax=Humulus lupulus TaxID=3486 RepID=UPI002B417C58|nr:E3 ubiquitin-protein ligase SGR9, amyloplastic [Humulus lupulus]